LISNLVAIRDGSLLAVFVQRYVPLRIHHMEEVAVEVQKLRGDLMKKSTSESTISRRLADEPPVFI